MKPLKESLLDDEDIQINDESVVEEYIKDWIKKYCAVKDRSKIIINKTPTGYVVDANVLSIKRNAPQVPTELFTFGTVANFYLDMNPFWINLKGAPKLVKNDCVISCINLESLEGSPEDVKDFICTSNKKLKNLKGLPKNIRGNVSFYDCSSLVDIKGLENVKKENWLCLDKCTSLTSLKGAPKYIYELGIDNCSSLKTLDHIPLVTR